MLLIVERETWGLPTDRDRQRQAKTDRDRQKWTETDRDRQEMEADKSRGDEDGD